MQITDKHVVTMHYTVSTENGDVIDSSFDKEPMVFLQGSHYMIDGIETAIEGRTKGDKFDTTVAPEQAYGERQEQLVQEVPASMFEDMEVEVGMTFRATTEGGEQSVMIVDTSDDTVTVDGNHPLSGITLNFSVEIVDIREATEEELAHGHVHSAGGCGHPH